MKQKDRKAKVAIYISKFFNFKLVYMKISIDFYLRIIAIKKVTAGTAFIITDAKDTDVYFAPKYTKF